MSEDAYREKFSTNEAARKYLEDKIWQGVPKCPKCGCIRTHEWRKDKPGYYRCNKCKNQFDVKADTVFEGTHIALRKWFVAWYYMVTDRKGISSMALSKKLGICQKTAWFLEQRIRHAMGTGKYDYMLGGMNKVVENDSTYAGGKKKNKHTNKKGPKGSGPVGKAVIFGMAERGGKVKSMVIPNEYRATIQNAIMQNVEKGTLLNTDEGRQFIGIEKFGYYRNSVNHKAKEYVRYDSAKPFVDKMACTNSIESVWALLKRGFYGTFHKFSLKHLQRYVDEFDFRWNEGNCKYTTMQRVDALIDKSYGKRLTWKALVGKNRCPEMIVPG
ncbi:MAG: IS1595 family transposase [Fibromonadales bacterium]|nr:IS1595 family transposase [Fibromonadales bacterium]